jgi:hypothetical protein
LEILGMIISELDYVDTLCLSTICKYFFAIGQSKLFELLPSIVDSWTGCRVPYIGNSDCDIELPEDEELYQRLEDKRYNEEDPPEHSETGSEEGPGEDNGRQFAIDIASDFDIEAPAIWLRSLPDAEKESCNNAEIREHAQAARKAVKLVLARMTSDATSLKEVTERLLEEIDILEDRQYIRHTEKDDEYYTHVKRTFRRRRTIFKRELTEGLHRRQLLAWIKELMLIRASGEDASRSRYADDLQRWSLYGLIQRVTDAWLDGSNTRHFKNKEYICAPDVSIDPYTVTGPWNTGLYGFRQILLGICAASETTSLGAPGCCCCWCVSPLDITVLGEMGNGTKWRRVRQEVLAETRDEIIEDLRELKKDSDEESGFDGEPTMRDFDLDSDGEDDSTREYEQELMLKEALKEHSRKSRWLDYK